MKLTGELNDKVDAVETNEEKKAIITEAGIELTDEEVEQITGGKKHTYRTVDARIIPKG